MKQILLAAALAVGLAVPAAAQEPAAPKPLSLQQLRQKYMAPDDKLMTLGGVEVRYRDEGKGPVVLLLHGSQSTLNSWDGVADVLKKKYRVIRFDLPPLGLSGPISDAATKTLPNVDALMEGFLKQLGVTELYVVGTSSGGTMAYYLTAKNPDKVKGLVLSNAPSDPLPETAPSPPEMKAAEERRKKLGFREKSWYRTYMTSLYAKPERITEDQIQRLYDFGSMYDRGNVLHLHALAGNNEETMKRLRGVKAPTLIIWGMADYVLPPERAVALRDHLTGTKASVIHMDDVGHYPPIEVPTRFANIVDTFISDVLPD